MYISDIAQIEIRCKLGQHLEIIKNIVTWKNETKATLTHMYIELFISKPTITSVWIWERWITQTQHKRMAMCTQIHTNKYIEHLN